MATSQIGGVLLIGNFLSGKGGSRGVCEDLADRLRARGWPVITASHHRLRLARVGDMLTTIWRRRHEYVVAHVDVYSGPAFVWAEAAGAILRQLRKPLVLTLHGGNLPAFAARWPGRVSRLLRSASTVTAPSTYLLERLRPLVTNPIRLIPNPLQLSDYEFRHRPDPAPALVWLRAFHGIYNPTLAVRVLAALRAEFPAARLTMIGPDKGDGALQQVRELAQRLNLQEHITFAGPIPKAAVGQWLNQGDIFLNTTHVDNTPVSVLEAMACGLCMVSTNVGGLPYLLEDGVDALLVPPDEAKAMAAAAARVLSEPGLARKLSSAARAKAAQHDWPALLPIWQQTLAEAADCAQPTPGTGLPIPRGPS